MNREIILKQLIVALIGITSGGAQIAQASALSDAAAALQPGEWVEFQTNGYGENLLSACNNINTILEWSNKATWNPVDNEVHFVGQGHVTCAKHIRFQESTNSWTTIASPDGIGTFGHGYEHSAVNPTNGDFFYRNYNSDRIEKFSISSENWSSLPNIGTSTQVAGAIAYFPEAGGLLFVDGDYGIYFYSSASNSWSVVANTTLTVDSSKPTLDMDSYHNFASYNPSDRAVYFGGGNGSQFVYKFDENRNVSQIASSPASIGINRGLTVPDPSSGTQLLFSNSGSLYEYDSTTNSWSGAGSHPVMSYARDWRVAVPISSYGVIMFLTWDFGNSKVLLYRHAEGSGTPIENSRPLAPSSLLAD
jgi:hypothetical protein